MPLLFHIAWLYHFSLSQCSVTVDIYSALWSQLGTVHGILLSSKVHRVRASVLEREVNRNELNHMVDGRGMTAVPILGPATEI